MEMRNIIVGGHHLSPHIFNKNISLIFPLKMLEEEDFELSQFEVSPPFPKR